MNETSRRVYLDVPYREKDEAKQLGAWWDPQEKKWFVPRGKDKAPFSRWFESQPVRSNEAEKRV